MIVDFHVHSTASDGTFRPAELAEKAVRGGFAALALTDHDNCNGVKELSSCPLSTSECNLHLIPGIELSIEPGSGFDKFHLLGLGVDPENPQLKALMKSILDGRNARNQRIRANFLRLGIDMPLDPRSRVVSEESASVPHSSFPVPRSSDIIARPHYARWLMEHGFARDIRDAFARYLLPESPSATRCYEERWHPAQEDAFAAIHAAGGVCVMAHPKYWRGDWKDVGCDFAAAGKELARLKEAGLDGIEAHYQANTGEENVEFTRIATKLGFLLSAGSDFHGDNKPTIPLGMEVSESFINPLMERLNLV